MRHARGSTFHDMVVIGDAVHEWETKRRSINKIIEESTIQHQMMLTIVLCDSSGNDHREFVSPGLTVEKTIILRLTIESAFNLAN